MPVLVAMRSRTWVCDGLNAETNVSKPTEDMGVLLLCLSCVVKEIAWPLRQANHLFRGVLLYACVPISLSSRNFQNEAAWTQFGMLHDKKNNTALQQSNDKHHKKVNMYSLLSIATGT